MVNLKLIHGGKSTKPKLEYPCACGYPECGSTEINELVASEELRGQSVERIAQYLSMTMVQFNHYRKTYVGFEQALKSNNITGLEN